MARYTFGNLNAWVQESEARLKAVARDAAQTVVNEVRKPKAQGGRMPVLTGNLRRSLMASTSQMPTMRPDGREFPDNEGQIELAIAGWELTETLYLGFQAAYARKREYDNGFVSMTAQRWGAIVEESARSIQARVG